MARRRFSRVATAAAGLLLLIGLGSEASATTIVAFDFENAAGGDFTAAASTVGAGISGASFGGSRADSQVQTAGGPDNIYRSSSLEMNLPGGGYFNFFRFTTSTTQNLGILYFAAGQNDVTGGTRDFEILLSPINEPAPSTGDQASSLGGYSLLSLIAVPNGFALGPQNFAIDLSATTLAPGDYNIAFAVSDPSQFAQQGTTQLFIDDVVLTPEPSTALLLGGGLLGLAGYGRRRKA